MKKRIYLIFTVLFLAILLFFGIGTLLRLGNSGGYDVFENRNLASAPALTAGTVADGSFFDGVETYLTDRLACRSVVLKADTVLQQLRGSVSVNGVITADGVLLNDYGIDREDCGSDAADAALIAARLAAVRDAAEACGGKLVYVGIPTKCEVYADSYPSFTENHNDALRRKTELLSAALAREQVDAVFLNDAFDAVSDRMPEYYSTVDHHFTLKGAALCWNAARGALGLPAEEYSFVTADDTLLGTYNRKLFMLTDVTDSLLAVDREEVPCERWDNGKPSSAAVLRLPANPGAYSTYTAYMGGDFGETVIKTNRPELPKLLIVGDSYTNAVEYLAYAEFDELRSLDYRYYDGAALTDYIAEYRPDYVAVIRNSSVCTDTSGNGAFNLD